VVKRGSYEPFLCLVFRMNWSFDNIRVFANTHLLPISVFLLISVLPAKVGIHSLQFTKNGYRIVRPSLPVRRERSSHSYAFVSLVCFRLTRMLSSHSYAFVSLVCFRLTRMLSSHSYAFVSLVCVRLTRERR
jgi:hypothetical protein